MFKSLNFGCRHFWSLGLVYLSHQSEWYLSLCVCQAGAVLHGHIRREQEGEPGGSQSLWDYWWWLLKSIKDKDETEKSKGIINLTKLTFDCLRSSIFFQRKKIKDDDIKAPTIPGYLKNRDGGRKTQAAPAGVETQRAGGEYSLTPRPSYPLHEELLPPPPPPRPQPPPPRPQPPPPRPQPPPPPRYKLPRTPPVPKRKLPRDPSVPRSLPATPNIVRKSYSRHRDITINTKKI